MNRNMTRCILLSACISLLFLSGCASRHPEEVDLPAVTFEPEAKEKAVPLKPEEVMALKTTGPLDSNLSSTAMADVTKQYRYYLYGGRKHLAVSIRRCEKYIPYAREIFRSNGLPEDLAYLGIVESGYRNEVKSHKGAAGVWQFMQHTGAQYGLDQDSWTDDRMDVYEATEAAARYLKKLYQEFRDWPTAIAAYNAGEGKIRRAGEESGCRNFFAIKERNDILSEKNKLREETKQYVPRFLAVVKIMRNLESLHFEPLRNENAYQVARITAQPKTDLKSLSRSLSLDWGTFCSLNSHHRGEISSAKRETFIYVPKDKATEAEAKLQQTGSGHYSGWKIVHVQRSGESWKRLATAYKVPEAQLKAANPLCTLTVGEPFLVPGTGKSGALYAEGMQERRNSLRGMQTPHPDSTRGRVHTLAANETLFSIARRYGLSPQELAFANGITDPSRLRAGTLLRIPEKKNRPTLAKNSSPMGKNAEAKNANGSLGKRERKEYVVQSNDTFWKIAQRHHVSVNDLKRWNQVDENHLRVGTILVVHGK